MAYAFPFPPLVTGMLWVLILGGISAAIWHRGELSLVDANADGKLALNAYGIMTVITSLMWGLLPATGRATSSNEYWDLSGEIAPTDSRERWKLEKQRLADEVRFPRRLMIGSVIGVLAGGAMTWWILGGSAGQWELLEIQWSAFMLTGLFVMLARGIALTQDAKKRHAPIYEAARHVDLLDLRPQLRAGRCSLRTAVSWMVGASLSSLFFLLNGDVITISILSFITVVALFSVAPPILRIQRIIRQAKDAEIERLHDEIRRAREEVLESTRTDGVTTEPGRLADLLAYLHYVETLPELPFEKGKLAFTTLYFTVPLFSWLWISLLQSWVGWMS